MSDRIVPFRLCMPAAALALVLPIAACTEAELAQWLPAELLPAPAPEAQTAQPVSQTPIPTSSARTAEQFDTTTSAERARAASPTATAGVLGRTTATLGAPQEPGFWLKTPLVASERAGVVQSRDTGGRVNVTLIPIDGPPTAGSRISLSAMRALGLPLTALAELDVSQAR